MLLNPNNFLSGLKARPRSKKSTSLMPVPCFSRCRLSIVDTVSGNLHTQGYVDGRAAAKALSLVRSMHEQLWVTPQGPACGARDPDRIRGPDPDDRALVKIVRVEQSNLRVLWLP